MRVWFRADDVGQEDDKFRLLVGIFEKNKIPLTAAVIPGLVNQEHVDFLNAHEIPVVQHGWLHVDYSGEANSEKKHEFGDERSYQQQFKDIVAGKNSMCSLFQEFLPVFVPPWHCMNQDTQRAVLAAGFLAVSLPSTHACTKEIKNIPVHATLVTDDDLLFSRFFAEVMVALQTRDVVGILVHHNELVSSKEVFRLEQALKLVKDRAHTAKFVTLADILKKNTVHERIVNATAIQEEVADASS